MCCSSHSLSIAAISSRDIIIARFYAKVARLTPGYNMHFVGGLRAKQHPRETKSGLNVSQQCHLSLSENGKWQICFPRMRRWSPRRCRVTLQNVAYECQTTPSGNEKRTKRFPRVSPVTLRKRKVADMLPKSATLVTTQMSNNSSKCHL